MKIVVLGAPGVGKGTVASLLSRKYGFPHVSTGDIFKEAIRRGDALGLKVKSIVESGRLVPDDVVDDVVKERLLKRDVRNGFFLDGYPRTVQQAISMDGFAMPDLILNFSAPRKVIIERLSGRRVCVKCGSIYHVKNNPPKSGGKCDKCGELLVKRKDDEESVVSKRLDVYDAQTKPLIDYYEGREEFVNVDSSFGMDEIDRIIDQCDKAIMSVKVV